MTLDGNSASAVVVNSGRPTSQSIAFAKDNGAWKFDLTSLFEMTDAAFEMMAQGQGGSTADFVVNMLEMTSGASIDQTIWQAPLKRPANEH